MTCPIFSDIDIEAYLADPTAPEWAGFREHYPTCAECSRELAEWSEVEALLRAASAPAEAVHPSEETLLAFRNHPADLAPDECRATGDHLSTCAVCRDALAAVESLGPERLGVRRPVAEAPPDLMSRLADALRSLAQLPPAPVPALALLALAVSIPVGLFVWFTLRGPAAAPTGAPDAQVASVEPAPEPVAPGPAEAPELEAAAPVEPRGESARVAAREAGERAAPGEVAAVTPPTRVEPEPAASKAPADLVRPEPEPHLVAEVPDDAAVLQLAKLTQAGPPLYVPPSRGMPSVRVGGGTRTGIAELPTVLALAPSHVGLAVEESPTLFWFLSEDSTVPAQFALIAPESIDPILEFTLPPPVEAGVHAVHLSERGVVLQPGTRYRWFVALVPDETRRSRDLVAGGVIERILPDRQLRAQLEDSQPLELGHLYARNGLWYDALGFLSAWIERYPEEAPLRAQRAALLEQVGLGEAAAWEKRAVQAPR